jgi:hypothetical protein
VIASSSETSAWDGSIWQRLERLNAILPRCRCEASSNASGRARGPTLQFSLDRIEIERYHRDTLQLALDETNRQYREWRNEQDQHRAREQASA